MTLGCCMHVCVTLGLGWPEEMAALALRVPLRDARISGLVSRLRWCSLEMTAHLLVPLPTALGLLVRDSRHSTINVKQ